MAYASQVDRAQGVCEVSAVTLVANDLDIGLDWQLDKQS